LGVIITFFNTFQFWLKSAILHFICISGHRSNWVGNPKPAMEPHGWITCDITQPDTPLKGHWSETTLTSVAFTWLNSSKHLRIVMLTSRNITEDRCLHFPTYFYFGFNRLTAVLPRLDSDTHNWMKIFNFYYINHKSICGLHLKIQSNCNKKKKGI
jgi:hypothetical protein